MYAINLDGRRIVLFRSDFFFLKVQLAFRHSIRKLSNISAPLQNINTEKGIFAIKPGKKLEFYCAVL